MATNNVTTQMLREHVTQLFAALNEHGIPKILEFFTDDVVWSQPFDGTVVGRTEADRVLQGMFSPMPDLHFPLEDQRVLVADDGTWAVSTWRMVGTMTGPVNPPGYQPTGKTANVVGSCLYEFRDGRIARHTIVYDAMDLLEQLGLMPAVDSLSTKIMARVQAVTIRLGRALHKR